MLPLSYSADTNRARALTALPSGCGGGGVGGGGGGKSTTRNYWVRYVRPWSIFRPHSS